MKVLKPNINDVVKVTSCDWYVWTGEYWRPLTEQEQLDLD